jgi:uncharacterized membrane protein
MQYYYAVLAFCMFIVFYFWFFYYLISFQIKVDTSQYGMIILSALILIPGLVYFTKFRDKYEEIIKKRSLSSFTLGIRIVSLIYVIFSLPAFTIGVILSTK